MTATITALKPTKLARKPIQASQETKPSKAAKREARRQAIVTSAVAGVALTLTGLSLTHLTSGIAKVTGGSSLESAAMAIGIDLGFVALEIAQVIRLPDATAKTVRRFAHPATLGTLAASAALNAFGFADHAAGYMIYPAIALGCAIPALIYALTRVAMAMAK